ncbi:MAG TPA: HAMP domain-containing sensor histidine kinase [Vicinamibacteria bacterium]|nr:HAMP domain-containing sensor histidine kinase [Vicinamibacteria bacterium]
MRAPRLTLLLAAALLVGTELVALSLLLRGIGEHQSGLATAALDRAMLLMPRIADWARTRGGLPGEVLTAPWLEPFDQLIIEDPKTRDLDEAGRARIANGELVVVSRLVDRVVSVFGAVHTDRGSLVIRLTETPNDASRLAADRTLIAQHALILLAALTGLFLAALGREAPQEETSSPALRAYEEAMSRLRLRDDERLAALDREKLRLTAILRDRETMARAGELTAGIVHEVRNSMGAIATQAKLAERSSDENCRLAATAIVDEVRVLQSVMNRFLDFIRTEKVQDEAFDLARLVERVTAREGSNHPARIDSEGVATAVRGDEDLLERAIENVVRNACQAAGESGRVLVRFGADPTHAFVMVEDDGPGIADIEKALRPFESARAGGLGLGLPLVLKILALHHGSLELGPGPSGKGTQAVCRWPKTVGGATSGNKERGDSPGAGHP